MAAGSASTALNSHVTTPDKFEHIFIITGPAGCGKSTVAEYLAKTMNVPFVEGDDYHPPANKEKMGNGIPLTDADRWDWLIILRNEAIKKLQDANCVMVTCSALKRKYRDVIRVANYEHPTVQIHFVYLKVSEAVLQERVAQRVGHYMKQDMVASQMAALEEPREDDETDVITIDVTNNKDEVKQESLQKVQAKLKEYDELLKERQTS